MTLDTLRRRLFLASVGSLMLLITALFALSLTSDVTAQRTTDVAYLERMATLLIYQLEADDTDAATLLATYEREMDIASILQSADGRTLYASAGIDEAALRAQLNDALAVSTKTTATVSSQSGVIEVQQNNQNYNLLPATIVAQNGAHYELLLLQTQPSLCAILAPQLPRSLLLWGAVLVLVVCATHLLLRRAFAPAETMLARQKTFVAAASHELKSPLAVIMANAELLEDESLSSSGRTRLATIDNECCRLARLAEELLLLTSHDTRQQPLSCAPVDVDALLITLYDTYAPLCARPSQRLTLTLPETPLPAPTSDGDCLNQILAIFLDNAFAHTPAGTCITLRAESTPKALTLAVSDDGPGVAPETAPHLFERFYRGDLAHSDKRHAGLGLAIAQTLAERLGGCVTFAPTPGGGATFTLTLPL